MSDKNLRGMTAPTVLFSEFDGDPERLRFAWECCGHVVMNISDLPTTVLVRHDVSRFMLRFLRLSLQTPTTKTPPAEPTGRVAAGARFSINPAPYDRNRWRTRALPSSEESALRAIQPAVRSRGEVQSLGLSAFQARSKRAWSASLTSYLAFTCANASINTLNTGRGAGISDAKFTFQFGSPSAAM